MDVLRLESQQERIEKPVGGSIYFIGNATMLLRYDRGFTTSSVSRPGTRSPW